ncbi:hypothetical protein [Corynebacterium sp. HMSC04H06]|nr:hypothetical protein [Corynebacterium sp. HMSC04H06]
MGTSRSNGTQEGDYSSPDGTIYRVDAETTEATAVAHLDTPATSIVFV